MYLASFERHSDVAEFDIERGIFGVRDRLGIAATDADISGIFVELEGNYLAFFRGEEGELQIWYSGRSLKVAQATISWCPLSESGLASFSVTDGDEQIDLSYRPKYPSIDDPTPFIEDEDFDFGLFIQNVMIDERRRAEIFSLNRR